MTCGQKTLAVSGNYCKIIRPTGMITLAEASDETSRDPWDMHCDLRTCSRRVNRNLCGAVRGGWSRVTTSWLDCTEFAIIASSPVSMFI